MPICLNMPSIPNVLASSGTIGTTRSPILESFKRLVISLTVAIVVETFLSPMPFIKGSKFLLSGIFNFLILFLLLGIKPPRFSRVFFIYEISGEFSGGLTYGNDSISSSLTGMSKLSRKALILSNDNFFT